MNTENETPEVTLIDAVALSVLQGSEFFETLSATYRKFHHIPSLKMADQVAQFVSDAAHWSVNQRMSNGRTLTAGETSEVQYLVSEIDKLRNIVGEALTAETMEIQRVNDTRAESEALVK